MGTYSELTVNCRLKSNTPQEVIDVFLSMQYDSSYSFEVFPQGFVGLGVCAYFPQVTYAIVNFGDAEGEAHVSLRLVQKESAELAAFVEWLRPHVEQGSGPRDLFATIHNEEDEKPNLYFKKLESMTIGELVKRKDVLFKHELDAAREEIERLQAEVKMLRADLSF